MNTPINGHFIHLTFDRGTLILKGLKHTHQASIPDSSIWQWDDRISAWRTDAIHYHSIKKNFTHAFGKMFVDQVPIPPLVRWPQVQLPPLRAEQAEAVHAWEVAGRRGQIIMPTGTGKTEVALAAMARLNVATLVVAPVRDLMYQWHRRILKALGYDSGIVGDTLFDIKPVTVTTYDSAYIHMDRMGDQFGLLIFDEEHHLPGPCRREAAILSTAPCRMGLTATPHRADGRHEDLDWLVGPVVYTMPFDQAKGDTLADFDIVRIPVALNADEQHTYDQCSRQVQHYIINRRKESPGYSWQHLCRDTSTDPQARQALKAFHLKQAVENRAKEKLRILEDIFRLHYGQSILVFTGSNLMAIDVSQRFLVPVILSHTPKKERIEVLDGFTSGRFSVLVANRVLDEGIDVPEAKVAVVIGGQGSTRQAKQRLGRILRKSANLRGVLYEVVCENTKEVFRSRNRRKSDAYQRTRHHRI